MNPVHEVPVRDQVEWLHAIPAEALLADLDREFGEAPPPHWAAIMRQPRAWLDGYASAIDEAWRAVEPLWAQSRPLLEREVARVGAAVMRGSLDLVLDRLHPASHFEDQVLSIRDPEPARISLDGRPLILVPMMAGRQSLICNLELPDVAWIGYPLPGLTQQAQTRQAQTLPARTPGTESAAGRPAHALLESVLGPMRAQILVAVNNPLAMSELARRACLAPSAVTYHCERLAAAGLVMRERHGREVRVSRTSRGSELVSLLAGARA